MFIVITAKLLDLFLVPNYSFSGNRASLSVFYKKLKSFPLFFNKSYGINSNKMALKYLHSDFVKVLKSLKIEVPEEVSIFETPTDLGKLIEIIHLTYLSY